MAKGDHQRLQNATDYSTAQSQGPLDQTRQRITDRGNTMWNNYQTGTNTNLADYGSVMNSYKNFINPSSTGSMTPGDTSSFGNLSDPNAWMSMVGNTPQLQSWLKAAYPNLDQAGIDYYTKGIQEKPGANPTEQAGSAQYWLGRIPEWLQQHGEGGSSSDPFYNGINSALSGYSNFAQTGGFSPEDLQNIRARMIAPIRSVYSQANSEVDRQRRLQHGYSPNYTAAKAKMAREQAYATSDASTNAEASIAQMLQSDKLAGLSGLSGTSSAARGQNLSAINGQTGLYGTNPGLSQTFGQQVGQNTNQDLAGQGLQQDIGAMRLKGLEAMSKTPGDFQSALGNIGGLISLISQGATAASGVDWSKLFGGGAGGFDNTQEAGGW